MTQGLTKAEQIYQNRDRKAKELKAEGKKIIGYLCSVTLWT
jgi:CO dehydrogenase/acetyl-CoA synthase beta subunit